MKGDLRWTKILFGGKRGGGVRVGAGVVVGVRLSISLEQPEMLLEQQLDILFYRNLARQR